MEFRLLGAVEVRDGGEPLELGPPKQRAVLAALLVDAGRPVRTETIVDRVWDNDPPAEARNALYAHIMRIRRMLPGRLGQPRLARASSGYLLDVDPDKVDWHRFRRLVEAARHPETGDEQRAELPREALGLWRGDPLADLSGSWVARVREGACQPARLRRPRAEIRIGESAHSDGSPSRRAPTTSSSSASLAMPVSMSWSCSRSITGSPYRRISEVRWGTPARRR